VCQLKTDTPNCDDWGFFGALMISKEVYVEIKVMRRQGKSLRQIAEAVGCAVNTVRSHILSADIPRYERKVKRPGKLAGFESYLRERQAAAHPNWIPASVLYREIVEQGYSGGTSLLRAFMHTLKPPVPAEPVIRFETQAGVQMQVDWVEFRKGQRPLYAFCATLGYSRASYVEFVSDMKVTTLISCHEHAFSAFGGVPKDVLYDNMKTVIVERDAYGEGEHRFHAGFLDYARHCGFVIKREFKFEVQRLT
jgi:transposase